MAFVQNNDIAVRFTITDGTDPYVINNLNDYSIYLYYLLGKDKVLIATYNKNEAGKYGIDVYDSANGKVDIVIHRQDTKKVPAGKIYAEIRIRTTADSDYVSSVQNTGVTGVEIGDLDTTANKNNLV